MSLRKWIPLSSIVLCATGASTALACDMALLPSHGSPEIALRTPQWVPSETLVAAIETCLLRGDPRVGRTSILQNIYNHHFGNRLRPGDDARYYDTSAGLLHPPIQDLAANVSAWTDDNVGWNPLTIFSPDYRTTHYKSAVLFQTWSTQGHGRPSEAASELYGSFYCYDPEISPLLTIEDRIDEGHNVRSDSSPPDSKIEARAAEGEFIPYVKWAEQKSDQNSHGDFLGVEISRLSVVVPASFRFDKRTMRFESTTERKVYDEPVDLPGYLSCLQAQLEGQ